MKTKIGLPAGLLVFGWIALLLFAPPFAGLADNSDYARVLQPAGFVPNDHPRYAHAYREHRLTPAAGDVAGILNPGVENELDYVSSLQLPLKAAMLLDYAAKLAAGGDPLVFDIRWLGLVHALLFAAGLTMFAAGLGVRKRHTRVLLFVLSLLMLCDAGYLVYFHSFYGEALSMSAGMLAAGGAVRLIYGDPARKAPLLLFYGACLLFVSAKVANAPFGPLAALFGAVLLLLRKDVFSRTFIAAGGIVLVLVSYLVYSSAPPWMKQVNHYQSIFYGVLKDSPSPAADLRELGIPEQYAVLAGTHGYMPDAPYDIYGETFRREVYDKAPVAKLALFYAKHPGRLLDKLRLSAESALPLRPSYLGNTLPGEGAEGRYSFTGKLSLWEPLRKQAVGFAFPAVLIVFACWAAALAASGFRQRRNPDPRALAGLAGGILLAATCAIQFVIPVLGNGEADLQKHMFLFNYCFDLMLIVSLCKLSDRLGARSSAAAAVLLGLAAAAAACTATGGGETAGLREGDVVQFGAGRGEPLLWTVLAREDEGWLLWARRSVASMPFDAADERQPPGEENRGSNDWAASDLRSWLNGEFLEEFTEEERRMICTVKLRTLLAAADAEHAELGGRPHYWNSHPLYVKQNEDQAYARRMPERVFVLDAGQLQRYVSEKGRTLRKAGVNSGAAPYWVRTPYASGSSEVRVVGADGFVYHRDAMTESVGVVPALFVSGSVKADAGSGTVRDPYRLSLPPSDGE